jgi:predicted metalloendopeptidase
MDVWKGFAMIAAMTVSACTMPAATPPAAALRSGIDFSFVDHRVRVQDDPYRFLNGKWLDSFQMPPDKSEYGSFAFISDQVQEQLRIILQGLPQAGNDADTQKIVDLYGSFMDEGRLEQLGVKPLAGEFAAIEAMKERSELAERLAHFNAIGVGTPFGMFVAPDAKDATRYAVMLNQGGLALPDRDYYLDAKFKEVRDKYRAHIERMLQAAGDDAPASAAAQILTLETALARAQWSRVENRDPLKTYNKTAIADLPTLMGGYSWDRYLRSTGLEGRVDFLIVRQPSYFGELGKLLQSTPLPAWRAYFKWRLLSSFAPYLSERFVDERFSFAGTVLRGTPENQPRWKRGFGLVDDVLGEALGRLYVQRYFPSESKARMRQLVANLLEAYRRDIGSLDWMGPETRAAAQAKLSRIAVKIGYPDAWRDYSALKIERDDLLGNVMRAGEFEHQRNIARLGRPVDRGEWRMTPQTVNASYNPTYNEITFPAAILQPPFFDAQADDAAIYGGIGAIIGHEISHGFDDSGSKFDGEGNLHDWFAPADHEKFTAKTQALVAQYDAYEPVPDYHVNGTLTLGENIGDNSGLAIAFKAYQLSLGVRGPRSSTVIRASNASIWVGSRPGAAKSGKPNWCDASNPIPMRHPGSAALRHCGIRPVSMRRSRSNAAIGPTFRRTSA